MFKQLWQTFAQYFMLLKFAGKNFAAKFHKSTCLVWLIFFSNVENTLNNVVEDVDSENKKVSSET